jgi:hypothetical protein
MAISAGSVSDRIFRAASVTPVADARGSLRLVRSLTLAAREVAVFPAMQRLHW